jgi:hypothetical protein
MARNGVKSGGKNWKPGQSGNPGGSTKELQKDVANFKQSLFSLFKKNQTLFEKEALAHPMETMKLLVQLCPKEIVDTEGNNINGVIVYLPQK